MNQKNFYSTTIPLLLSLFFFSLFMTTSSVSASNKVAPAQLRQKPLVIIKPVNLIKARGLVMERYYKGRMNKVALFANPVIKKAGSIISSWKNPHMLRVKRDSWFFFVDEQPGANWEHRACYILVDRATGKITKYPAMSPPVGILKLRPENRIAKNELRIIRKNPGRLLPRGVVKPVRIPRCKKYALLLSGGMNSQYNYNRYWNDLKFMYKALKNRYGYSDREIIVLFANGTHRPTGDLDGNGTNDIDYAATKANLTKVMNCISRFIDRNGKFFFFSTNHGGDDPGAYKSNLTLWGESIKDYEFIALAKRIKCAETIYVMEQCFSGGMMDDILKAQPHPCTRPKVCVMTAARHDEPSWSCDTEGEYDEYVYHWISAVYGKTPSGTPVNADSNGDGRITMAEAHNYAKRMDSRNEHPQIGSCLTGACNATLGYVSTSLKEDCISFNPKRVVLKKINNRWKIVEGRHWIFDFGNKRNEAIKALKIIKHYGMNQVCFVGRPDPSFEYLLVNGHSPAGSFNGEDCIAFNPRNIRVKKVNGRWKIVEGRHLIFDFGNKRNEAIKAFKIIKKYGFNKTCYVGRPGPSFSYLRR